MAKPYPFPDPNNCSPNSPVFIVPSDKVVDIYNRYHKGKEKAQQYVTSKVQTWFIEKAQNEYHWDSAEFAGSECILRIEMKKIEIPDE